MNSNYLAVNIRPIIGRRYLFRKKFKDIHYVIFDVVHYIRFVWKHSTKWATVNHPMYCNFLHLDKVKKIIKIQNKKFHTFP
ncbi:hypothetical protein BLA29_014386 [Euroglyphus maynei]|uniref:Uncharacterized protein n=1 Tax=Euroglyphus maynei TaxID=6958 RepID=A0A1Y3BS30_EURMA|nr:hypothetical protein BLA29_014386 [Euroglyphus maynei]